MQKKKAIGKWQIKKEDIGIPMRYWNFLVKKGSKKV